MYEFSYLLSAQESGDPNVVAEAVAQFRPSARDTKADTSAFNYALQALYVTRRGESAVPMLETYNDMINLSVQPDARTYGLLLMAMTERDFELGTHIKSLSDAIKRHRLGLEKNKAPHFQRRIQVLSQEHKDNFASVLSLFYTAKNTVEPLPLKVHIDVMRTCGFHSNIDAALQVFYHVEKLYEKKLSSRFYQVLIQIYGNNNDISSAEQVFQRYVTAGREGTLIPEVSASDTQKYHIVCWNTMIEAYFSCGLPDKAVGLLDQMMNSPADLYFGPADTPHPAASTYNTVLKGFCDAGDVQTALVWYERLMEQGVEMKDGFWPSKQPIKPDEHVTSVLIQALAKHGHVSEMNKLYSTLGDLHEWDKKRIPLLVFKANMFAIQTLDDAEAKRVLEFLTSDVLSKINKPKLQRLVGVQIAMEYLRRELLEDALVYFVDFLGKQMEEYKSGSGFGTSDVMSHFQASLLEFQGAFLETVVRKPGNLTCGAAITLMQMGQHIGGEIPRRYQKHVIPA